MIKITFKANKWNDMKILFNVIKILEKNLFLSWALRNDKHLRCHIRLYRGTPGVAREFAEA